MLRKVYGGAKPDLSDKRSKKTVNGRPLHSVVRTLPLTPPALGCGQAEMLRVFSAADQSAMGTTAIDHAQKLTAQAVANVAVLAEGPIAQKVPTFQKAMTKLNEANKHLQLAITKQELEAIASVQQSRRTKKGNQQSSEEVEAMDLDGEKGLERRSEDELHFEDKKYHEESSADDEASLQRNVAQDRPQSQTVRMGLKAAQQRHQRDFAGGPEARADMDRERDGAFKTDGMDVKPALQNAKDRESAEEESSHSWDPTDFWIKVDRKNEVRKAARQQARRDVAAEAAAKASEAWNATHYVPSGQDVSFQKAQAAGDYVAMTASARTAEEMHAARAALAASASTDLAQKERAALTAVGMAPRPNEQRLETLSDPSERAKQPVDGKAGNATKDRTPAPIEDARVVRGHEQKEYLRRRQAMATAEEQASAQARATQKSAVTLAAALRAKDENTISGKIQAAIAYPPVDEMKVSEDLQCQDLACFLRSKRAKAVAGRPASFLQLTDPEGKMHRDSPILPAVMRSAVNLAAPKSNLASLIDDATRPLNGVSKLAAADRTAGQTARVTIVSLCDASEEPGVCSASRANLEAYAVTHGYGTRIFSRIPTSTAARSVTWYKVPLLLSALNSPGVDFVVWMPPDTLIMNMTLPLPLDTVLPGDVQVASTANRGGVGASSAGLTDRCFITAQPLILKRGKIARELLHQTWDAYPAPRSNSVRDEKAAMAYVLGGRRKDCRSRMDKDECCGAMANADTLAGTKYGEAFRTLTGRGWHGDLTGSELFQPGDFMMHFSETSRSAKASAMQKFHRIALKTQEVSR